jgi:rubrerythrin
VTDPKAKDVLHQIAKEEQQHLARLGKLMDTL